MPKTPANINVSPSRTAQPRRRKLSHGQIQSPPRTSASNFMNVSDPMKKRFLRSWDVPSSSKAPKVVEGSSPATSHHLTCQARRRPKLLLTDGAGNFVPNPLSLPFNTSKPCALTIPSWAREIGDGGPSQSTAFPLNHRLPCLVASSQTNDCVPDGDNTGSSPNVLNRRPPSTLLTANPTGRCSVDSSGLVKASEPDKNKRTPPSKSLPSSSNRRLPHMPVNCSPAEQDTPERGQGLLQNPDQSGWCSGESSSGALRPASKVQSSGADSSQPLVNVSLSTGKHSARERSMDSCVLDSDLVARPLCTSTNSEFKPVTHRLEKFSKPVPPDDVEGADSEAMDVTGAPMTFSSIRVNRSRPMNSRNPTGIPQRPRETIRHINVDVNTPRTPEEGGVIASASSPPASPRSSPSSQQISLQPTNSQLPSRQQPSLQPASPQPTSQQPLSSQPAHSQPIPLQPASLQPTFSPPKSLRPASPPLTSPQPTTSLSPAYQSHTPLPSFLHATSSPQRAYHPRDLLLFYRRPSTPPSEAHHLHIMSPPCPLPTHDLDQPHIPLLSAYPQATSSSELASDIPKFSPLPPACPMPSVSSPPTASSPPLASSTLPGCPFPSTSLPTSHTTSAPPASESAHILGRIPRVRLPPVACTPPSATARSTEHAPTAASVTLPKSNPSPVLGEQNRRRGGDKVIKVGRRAGTVHYWRSSLQMPKSSAKKGSSKNDTGLKRVHSSKKALMSSCNRAVPIAPTPSCLVQQIAQGFGDGATKRHNGEGVDKTPASQGVSIRPSHQFWRHATKLPSMTPEEVLAKRLCRRMRDDNCENEAGISESGVREEVGGPYQVAGHSGSTTVGNDEQEGEFGSTPQMSLDEEQNEIRRLHVLKDYELDKLESDARSRYHVRMNLRGKQKLENWLHLGDNVALSSAKYIVLALNLDRRLVSGNKKEMQYALKEMDNQTLRKLEALKMRTSTRNGRTNWGFLTASFIGDEEEIGRQV